MNFISQHSYVFIIIFYLFYYYYYHYYYVVLSLNMHFQITDRISIRSVFKRIGYSVFKGPLYY